ncbi:MAG: CBS domain-containing protein [Myxococcota bacterium]|jgi:CBS domain-containing protein|nr:CBS domain-containing protein [Myxococcota bacterium]
MQCRLPEIAAATSVTVVMASPVVTVDEEAPVRDMIRLFIAGGIGAAPVVNPRGEPIGVVSKTDVLRAVYEDPSCAGGGAAVELEADTEQDLRARDLMTPDPLTVPESASVSDAASLMAREHVHRLFVIGPKGALTGVVSAMDLVAWLARDEPA